MKSMVTVLIAMVKFKKYSATIW